MRRSHPPGLIAGMLLLVGCTGGQPAATGGQSPPATPSIGSPGAATSPTTAASESPHAAPDLLVSGAVNCDITGKVEEFPFQLYGIFDVRGAEDHVLVAQEGPAEPFVYEALTRASIVWERSNGAPWGSAKGDADTVARLRRSIDRASGWTDLGAQTTAGQTVHRMKAAGTPVSAADFGLEYPGGVDSSLSLEIETAAHGAPIAMHVAGKSLNAELTCGGRPFSRPAKPPTWKQVTLSHGVSMMVPEDWELDRSDPTRLVVTGPDRQWLAVQGAPAKGLTLQEWTKDGAAYFSKNWQATPKAANLIRVGNLDVALATWHLPLEGLQTLFLDVSAVRDGQGYDIEFFSQTDREPADRALFEQILTTVTFGKP